MKWEAALDEGGISTIYEGYHLHVSPMGGMFSARIWKPGYSYRLAPQKTIDAACKAASMKAESLRDSEGGAA